MHVAADEQYQGSIRTYNNKIVSSLAKFFGYAVDINLDGNHCVNKISYAKFLLGLGVQSASSLKNISKYRNLSEIKIQLINTKGLMRHQLSAKKSKELGKLLVNAMPLGNIETIRRLLRHGANPNYRFWSSTGAGEGYISPLMYACEISNHKISKNYKDLLIDELKTFGANVNYRAKIWNSKRVEIPHEEYLVNPYDVPCYTVVYKEYYAFDPVNNSIKRLNPKYLD